MPKNAKQVTLPAAAIEHMAPRAEDNLTDHFVFNPNVVKHTSSPSQPSEHVPEHAVDHVPPVVPPPVTLPDAALHHMAHQAEDNLADHFVFNPNVVNNTAFHSQALGHVPEQALGHVPPEVPPPVTLPDAADHMADIAKVQLAAHTDWFV